MFFSTITGEDQPRPVVGVFQRMFFDGELAAGSSSAHSRGSFTVAFAGSVIVPFWFGPRNSGQSARAMEEGSGSRK